MVEHLVKTYSLESAHSQSPHHLCLCTQAEEDTPVAVYAEGKQHATAVGLTKMSTADIRAINKGIGVETLHYLNDGLWKTDDFS